MFRIAHKIGQRKQPNLSSFSRGFLFILINVIMETESNQTPLVVIGGNGQWGKTIIQSLHEMSPPFQNVQVVEKDDFPGRKNAAIATSEIIIHAAGEEAMEEM